MGTSRVNVLVAVAAPPTEAGELYPEPEFFMGVRPNVTTGFAAVDPVNFKSASILQQNAKCCPSSRSNCALVMKDSIATGVPVVLSSQPIS
jgi:hypothetical protein